MYVCIQFIHKGYITYVSIYQTLKDGQNIEINMQPLFKMSEDQMVQFMEIYPLYGFVLEVSVIRYCISQDSVEKNNFSQDEYNVGNELNGGGWGWGMKSNNGQ